MIKDRSSLILLTYKGKILVMHRDNNPLVQNPWTFIEGKRGAKTSFLETIIRKVEEETSLRLEEPKFISSAKDDGTEKHFFHADLSDKEVNSINRDEGLTLGFYSLKEIEKLSLTASTRAFVAKVRDFMEELPN